MELRFYQTKAVDLTRKWLNTYTGFPVISAPTGSGKSVIGAALIQYAISKDPTIRALLLTHVKELIEQDHDALLRVWPSVDAGVYSAGLGRRELGHQVTCAGIASVYKKATELGKIDICLVDECHLINNENMGMYRRLIADLQKINPRLLVVGLSATPYRVGSGMVTDPPGIFTAPIIQPVTIKELQDSGYLCRLRSKATETRYDLDGVKTVAGDYNRKELEKAVDVPGKTRDAVIESIKRAEGRHSWLFFCAGVHHAENVRDILRENGINAECVSQKTPKDERAHILEDFKAGKITALTNANVLTTGFDAPNIDLIVMLRPTKSPGLYLQMVGRGLRISPTKKDCLVLDFAENIMRHGPITDVQPPSAVKHKGVAPSKICPNCLEIVPMNAHVCPICGHEWSVSPPKQESYQLDGESDINGDGIKQPKLLDVSRWEWKKSISRAGNPMIVITYFLAGRNLQAPIKQYLMPWSDSMWRSMDAARQLKALAERAGVKTGNVFNAETICSYVNCTGKAPKSIKVIKNDRGYFSVVDVRWQEAHDGSIPISS